MSNTKGMTMVEMLVSIALISVVLILLMSLFLTSRDLYNKSKNQSDFNILSSTIIKAVSDDIENYGLYSVSNKSDGSDALVLTFNTFRKTKLSERIVKVLKVYYNNTTKKYYISYTYDSDLTDNLTSTERMTNEVRVIPDGAVVNTSRLIDFSIEQLNSQERLIKIKIPLTNNYGNVYDINIYGVIK